MKITPIQMQAISRLLSKSDKEVIASKANMSVRTVEAVLQSNRQNEHVQKLIVEIAASNWESIGKHFQEINSKNIDRISMEGYSEAKASSLWSVGHEYDRYIDAYLQLSGTDWKDVEELWKKLKESYSDILQLPYYTVDLIVRILGISSEVVVKKYNQAFYKA